MFNISENNADRQTSEAGLAKEMTDDLNHEISRY